jgi:hypothetical protein
MVLCGLVVVTGVGMLATGDAPPGVRITGACIAILSVWLARGALASGVWAGEDGVVVRHLVTSRHIPWTQIKGFSVGPGTNIAQRTHTLYVELKDGQRVRVQEVSASAAIHRGRSHVHDAQAALTREMHGRTRSSSSGEG